MFSVVIRRFRNAFLWMGAIWAILEKSKYLRCSTHL